MEAYWWQKSTYTCTVGKWYLCILLMAGWRLIPATEAARYRRVADGLCFRPPELPYPQSQTMLPAEVDCFCDGLRMVWGEIRRSVPIPGDAVLLVALGEIHFSVCDVQDEGFTAAAIQWASEAFDFPMPEIGVSFDLPGWRYQYDFSAVSPSDEEREDHR